MRRVAWWVGANLAILGLLFAGFVLVFHPSWGGMEDSVFVSKESWGVNISYTPSQDEVLVSLRMDGLSKYKTLAYDVTSSYPWAPHWQAQMEGTFSEFLTLNDGYTKAPHPLTAQEVEDLARSYRVVLKLDGQEKVIDFRDGSTGRVSPVFSLRR